MSVSYGLSDPRRWLDLGQLAYTALQEDALLRKDTSPEGLRGGRPPVGGCEGRKRCTELPGSGPPGSAREPTYTPRESAWDPATERSQGENRNQQKVSSKFTSGAWEVAPAQNSTGLGSKKEGGREQAMGFSTLIIQYLCWSPGKRLCTASGI